MVSIVFFFLRFLYFNMYFISLNLKSHKLLSIGGEISFFARMVAPESISYKLLQVYQEQASMFALDTSGNIKMLYIVSDTTLYIYAWSSFIYFVKVRLSAFLSYFFFSKILFTERMYNCSPFDIIHCLFTKQASVFSMPRKVSFFE